MGVAAKSAQNTQVHLEKLGKLGLINFSHRRGELSMGSKSCWVAKLEIPELQRRCRGESASDLLTPIFQLFFHRVPFELTQGEGDRVVYPLNYGGKDIQLTSEQITAALFTKLKDIGENALGTKVGFVKSMAMPAETGAVS